jgi:hypothetical protein
MDGAIGAACKHSVVVADAASLVQVAFILNGLLFSLYGIGVAHTNDRLIGDGVLEASRGLLVLCGVGAFTRGRCWPIGRWSAPFLMACSMLAR